MKTEEIKKTRNREQSEKQAKVLEETVIYLDLEKSKQLLTLDIFEPGCLKMLKCPIFSCMGHRNVRYVHITLSLALTTLTFEAS